MSKANTITHERLKEVLHYDASTGEFRRIGALARRSIGGLTNGVGNHGYVNIRVDSKLYLAHRLAWLYVYGEWPPHHIDHINGIRTDNRIENLRCVTNAINCQNKRTPLGHNKSSQYLGVSKVKKTGRWAAYIVLNKSRRYLGSYEEEETAHQAYVKAKRELHEGCTI